MSEPTKLIHQRSLEGTLLRAVRRETPPAHAHERMLSTLGIAATVATATTAKVAAAAAVANAKPVVTAITGAFIAKWAIVGSVGALVTVGVAREVPVLFSHGSHLAAAPSANSTSSLGGPTRAGREGANPAVRDEPATVAAPETAPNDTRSQSRATKPTSSVRTPAVDDLAAEVSAIDQARTVAAAHDPARTLALLDTYQRQFPNGSLQPEAQLLRIEALIQRGQRAQALPIARRLLEAAPDGPLAERIHGLLPEIE
jgi:hypothetical protein